MKGTQRLEGNAVCLDAVDSVLQQVKETVDNEAPELADAVDWDTVRDWLSQDSVRLPLHGPCSRDCAGCSMCILTRSQMGLWLDIVPMIPVEYMRPFEMHALAELLIADHGPREHLRARDKTEQLNMGKLRELARLSKKAEVLARKKAAASGKEVVKAVPAQGKVKQMKRAVNKEAEDSDSAADGSSDNGDAESASSESADGDTDIDVEISDDDEGEPVGAADRSILSDAFASVESPTLVPLVAAKFSVSTVTATSGTMLAHVYDANGGMPRREFFL
eukprot:TRINITY_DN8361_c0_g1_i9.p1 TRINITY_DN8361_c0_g1~~TRINITY_DN8361_c0_g1_i9.p1  ORF type:complete len:277 (+),score=37.35 TRINITY_DN8361_c0_g1_i9:486-1316(+)